MVLMSKINFYWKKYPKSTSGCQEDIWHHEIWHLMTFDISCRLTFHVDWHYMSVDITCRLTLHVGWHDSCVMCHMSCVMSSISLMSSNVLSFDILCHLTFRVIQHFVTFCVIWHFVSFDISCDHYCNHSHQSHHGIYAQVVVEDRCVLKKWVAV